MPDVLLELQLPLGLVARFYFRDDQRIGLVVESRTEELVTLAFDAEALLSVVDAWRDRMAKLYREAEGAPVDCPDCDGTGRGGVGKAYIADCQTCKGTGHVGRS